MSDELYFRRRADAEGHLAATAAVPRVRSIHEALRHAYQERADALRADRQTS